MKEIRIAGTDLALSPIGLGTVNAGIAWDHEDAFGFLTVILRPGAI